MNKKKLDTFSYYDIISLLERERERERERWCVDCGKPGSMMDSGGSKFFFQGSH